jgi:hypothetical protein
VKDYGCVCERYSDSHYEQMMRSLDHVETILGYSVKRCDRISGVSVSWLLDNSVKESGRSYWRLWRGYSRFLCDEVLAT